SLRGDVRSAVYSHDSGCGDEGRAFHDPGRARTYLQAAGQDELVSLDTSDQCGDRGGLGIFSMARGEGPARWDQFSLAAVWNREPVAGDGRALRGDHDYRQDASGKICGCNPGSAGLACGRDLYSFMAQGLLRASSVLISRTSACSCHRRLTLINIVTES